MQNSGLLDPFPLWTLLPITIAIALASVEIGFRVALYRKQRSADEPEAPAAGMVGATLGLLAFMLAFTFGLAGTRFEARRSSCKRKQTPSAPRIFGQTCWPNRCTPMPKRY